MTSHQAEQLDECDLDDGEEIIEMTFSKEGEVVWEGRNPQGTCVSIKGGHTVKIEDRVIKPVGPCDCSDGCVNCLFRCCPCRLCQRFRGLFDGQCICTLVIIIFFCLIVTLIWIYYDSIFRDAQRA